MALVFEDRTVGTKVTAMRFTGGLLNVEKINDWIRTAGRVSRWEMPLIGKKDDGSSYRTREEYMEIETVQGWRPVQLGEWIVRFSSGHFWSFTPERFRDSYRPVTVQNHTKEAMEEQTYFETPEKFKAIQFTGGMENATEVIQWLKDNVNDGIGRHGRWVPNIHSEDAEFIEMGRENVHLGTWLVIGDRSHLNYFTDEQFKTRFKTEQLIKNAPRVRLHKAVEKDLGIELLWADLDKVDPPLSRELRDQICASRFNKLYGKQHDVLSEAFGMFMKPQKKTEAPTLAELLENPAMKGLFNHFYGKQETEEGSDSDTNESAKEEKLEPKRFYTDVDAMQFTGGKENGVAVCYWVGKNGGTAVWTERQLYHNTDTIAISNGGQTYHVRPGMWILRQSDGTFATCIDGVFQKNYHPHAEKDAEADLIDPETFNRNALAYLREVGGSWDSETFSLNKIREALGFQKLPVVNINITNHGVVEEMDAVSAYPETETTGVPLHPGPPKDSMDTGERIAGMWYPRYFQLVGSDSHFYVGQEDGSVRLVEKSVIPKGHMVYPVGREQLLQFPKASDL